MVDTEGYFILLIIFLISTTLLVRAFTKSTTCSGSRFPPTPFRLPIIGHLHLLAPLPHQAFQKLSVRYGPVFRVFLGSVPCVVACSAEMAKDFLKTNEGCYLDRPQTISTTYLTYGLKDFAFAPYGSYWKLMKKLIMSELLNGSMLDLHLPVRRDEIDRLIKALSQKAKAGEAADLGGELVKMTNNVISRMVMNERCSDDENGAGEMRKLVSEIAELLGRFNFSDYIWICKNLDLQGFGRRLKDVRGRYDSVVERIITAHEDERRQTKERGKVKDLLDVLLDMSEDENTEMNITRDNIKAFMENMLVAGTDTTAESIEWALAEVINHPNVMKKAVEEIDRVVGKTRLLEESDIQNLPYVQAIVKETMRLHPGVPVIPRKSTKDCTVGGYHVPANTSVFVNVWAIGRDPNHWDNPLEFRPERFEKSSQLDVRGQHFEMLPFGSGRRMCPGISLALQVLPTALGVMIQCFEWKAGKQGNESRVDMEEGPGLNLPRANPLVCVPFARLDPMPLLI